ncbi:MAG TPA: outer membrane protein assembly factor BamA [Longimicrobiales bacterium]|nr:outer membrane protein assembly factor BamA [Longimicrobiales bacterium]
MKKAIALAAAFFSFLLLAVAPSAGEAQQSAQTQAPRTVQVDSVLVEGNRRLQSQSIVGLFGVQPGDEIDYRDIQQGMKRLLSSGQFSDVVVRALPPPREGVLLIEVEEQARVRRVVISGLENVSPREVRDTTDLEAGLPLNRQRILDAREFIRSELIDDGIPFARIEERIEPVEGTANEVDLFIDVDEGQRVTVAAIDFVGNEGMSEDALRGAMAVRREGFWWFQTGSFNELEYEEDLQASIPSIYRSRGYLDARIVADTVIVDPQTGKARVEVTVDEGEQYLLNSFTVEGNAQFEDEAFESLFIQPRGGILRTLGLGGSEETNARGQVFDAEAFEEARQRAVEQYANSGYIYAQVNPVVTKVEAEDGTPMVDASWQVIEGQPALINRVNIVGNEYMHEWVIRNQLTVIPGDVYSQDRVIRSWQSISALGFFETPMPPPDIQPDPETGDVDITFEVVERQTGSINFGTSVGGGVGLSGFIGYEQPNLFGQAKSGSLRWDFGRYLNSFEVAYTDPALFQSMTSGTISLFNSRDRFFQFASGRRRRLGANVRLGFPWQRSLFTRLFVGYGISRTTYEQFNDSEDTSLFGRPPGVQSQLSLGVTRQTLDHPIFPTVGSRQNLVVELNGGLLGGDGQFTRVLGDGSFWVPVGSIGGDGAANAGIRMSLGLTLRAGAVLGNVDAFPFDRFWMGGVQFGQNLRGYDETSITPRGYFPERAGGISDIDRLGNAFFTMTTAFAIRPSDQISLNFFYDAGNVWRTPGEIAPTRLFRGAGFGIQLVTPFGPIGLDYAYGFDKPTPGWQLHFRMGPGF